MDEYWNPKLVIPNLLDSSKDIIWKEVKFSKAEEAYIVQKRRIKGNFTEKLELENFPFDSQVRLHYYFKTNNIL